MRPALWPRARNCSAETALLAVHVVDGLALYAVDLQLVEPRPFEDPVAVAGRGEAVQHHPGLLDRRLVGVDCREEVRRVEAKQLRGLRRFPVVGVVEPGRHDLGVVEPGLDPEPWGAPAAG